MFWKLLLHTLEDLYWSYKSIDLIIGQIVFEVPYLFVDIISDDLHIVLKIRLVIEVLAELMDLLLSILLIVSNREERCLTFRWRRSLWAWYPWEFFITTWCCPNFFGALFDCEHVFQELELFWVSGLAAGSHFSSFGLNIAFLSVSIFITYESINHVIIHLTFKRFIVHLEWVVFLPRFILITSYIGSSILLVVGQPGVDSDGVVIATFPVSAARVYARTSLWELLWCWEIRVITIFCMLTWSRFITDDFQI